MPKAAKKRSGRRTQEMQYFVFEIGEWEPSYILSVDYGRDRTGAYREHIGIDLQTSCIFPEKLRGRSVLFNIAGERGCLTPAIWQHDPDWTPNCVGLLALPPSGGRFYSTVPHESPAMLVPSLIHRLFRYILLYGPPLSRGSSLCTSMQWERAVNLEDY